MTRRPKLALTAAAALAVGAALAYAVAPAGSGGSLSVSLGGPAFAAPGETPEEMAAAWEKQRERAVSESAKEYERLYKWCMDKKLNFQAINMRRFVLRYEPENEEVRKFVGYAKTPDGTWIVNEGRKLQIREEADIEDPKAQKLPEKQATTTKKVADIWKRLAEKARKNGETDAANAAAWKERAAASWERVLQVDSTHEQAHKALNHPKFANKYVRPEALPFLKVRQERKDLGQKHGQLQFKVQPVSPDGFFATAGLTGGAAKSEHLTVMTSHGKDKAAESAVWGERGLQDFVEIYGIDPEIKQRLPYNRFSHVKDKPELEQFLSRGTLWSQQRVQELVKIFGGTTLENGECVIIASAGTDADDHVLHYLGHALAMAARNIGVQEYGSPSDTLEDWLPETVGYDLTRRLTGTTLTTCGQFGKYGNDIEPNPEKDIWIELARRQVEYDDDVPLAKLYKYTHREQQIHGPEIVKGYAFFQFLFEDDTEKAREWVKRALAQGTPAATLAVYEMDMDQIDAKYRDWIIKSW